MDLPTQDEVNILRHLPSLHNDGQLVVLLGVFVDLIALVILVLVESELAVVKNLSSELLLAILEDELEYFIVHLEHLIDYFVFEPWLQLVEDLGVFDHHGIELVPVVVKALHSLKDLVGHKLILPGFVKGDQPVVQRLLLLSELVSSLNSSEQILKSTDHVPVEADTYHLNDDLVLVLIICVPLNVPIPHRGERCDDPVHRSDVKTPKISLLNPGELVLMNPPISIFLMLLGPDEEPTASKEVRDKEHHYKKVKNVYALEKLLLLEVVTEELKKELVDILLVSSEPNQF